MKIPVIATGLSGLIGTKIADLLQTDFRFTNLDLSNRSQRVDITNYEQVEKAVCSQEGAPILHLAAYTDVSGAWEQTNDKNGLCYRINVLGTENVVKVASKHQRYLIHVSTAYVFDGEKQIPYDESDLPRPIEWYGQTKAEAEEIVRSCQTPWSILRIDQPFRSDNFVRADVVARILEKLKAKSLPAQFTDHTFGPTFVDDFARIVAWVLSHQPTGIYHASSGEAWTDWQFARKICALAGLDEKLVKPGSLENYLKSQTRPYQANTVLNTNKLQNLIDFSLTPVAQALAQRLSSIPVE